MPTATREWLTRVGPEESDNEVKLAFSVVDQGPPIVRRTGGVTWQNSLLPGYPEDGSRGPNGQSKIFLRNSLDGVTFAGPAQQIDALPTGHQWLPDIASDDGKITVVFFDSREDPAYSPTRPPANTAGGFNSVTW